MAARSLVNGKSYVYDFGKGWNPETGKFEKAGWKRDYFRPNLRLRLYKFFNSFL